MMYEDVSDFFLALSFAALLLMLFVIIKSRSMKPAQRTFLKIITIVMLIYLVSEPVEWYIGDYSEAVLHVSAALVFLGALLYQKRQA
jgi:hypothetical protein